MATLPDQLSGRMQGRTHCLMLRAYFGDTDAGGVVYHANYLRWFEQARSEMLRLIDIDTRAELEAGSGTYAIADLAIRYARPARLADVVTIESEVSEVGAASWRMVQRALRDGQLLAEARPRIGFVSLDGRPLRQPAAWRAALEQLLPDRIPA